MPVRTLNDIRDQLRDELPTLRERYAVDRIGICGSFVRGEQTEGSDLDLLVTFTDTPGLIEFIRLQHYLEDRLELSVDLGTPGGLKEGPAAENIRREVEYL
jgi:hypothetical protein